MKKLLETALFVSGALFLASCGGEEKVKCQHDPHMSDQICPDKKITICATESGDEVWIKIDDKKYKCEGSIYDDSDFCQNVIDKLYDECHTDTTCATNFDCPDGQSCIESHCR